MEAEFAASGCWNGAARWLVASSGSCAAAKKIQLDLLANNRTGHISHDLHACLACLVEVPKLYVTYAEIFGEAVYACLHILLVTSGNEKTRQMIIEQTKMFVTEQRDDVLLRRLEGLDKVC